jgi:DNA-binding beta-propeller fold protein YncE
VVSPYSDTVTPILIATSKAGKLIKVGSTPDAIAVSSNEKCIANYNSDTATPIDPPPSLQGSPSRPGSTPLPSRSRRYDRIAGAVPRGG